jgi:hypothetical protein
LLSRRTLIAQIPLNAVIFKNKIHLLTREPTRKYLSVRVYRRAGSGWFIPDSLIIFLNLFSFTKVLAIILGKLQIVLCRLHLEDR